jgi:membrane protein DedA with SNARE-associated domain
MHAVTGLIHDYGVWAVAAVVALECVGLPLPGETALLAAAMYAGTTHDLNIFSVLIVAATAAIIGRMVGYLVGWEFHWLLIRYGSYIRMTESRIKLGQYLFLQHGGKVVLVAQFVPILRTIAGVLAGVNMMPWRTFVATNVLGACAWAALYGYAAYTFGHQFRHLEASAMVVLGIITAAIIIFGVVFIRRHEAQLIAKAEAALPGPLDLPQRSQRSTKLTFSRMLSGYRVMLEKSYSRDGLFRLAQEEGRRAVHPWKPGQYIDGNKALNEARERVRADH